MIETQNTVVSNIQIYDNVANSTFGGYNYLMLNTGTVSINSTSIVEPLYTATSIRKATRSIQTAISNGQSLTISIPANRSGNIQMWGTSGGAWVSTANYTFLSSGAFVQVKKINDDFISPGQLFGSLTTSGLTITIPTTATGSGGLVKYILEYI